MAVRARNAHAFLLGISFVVFDAAGAGTAIAQDASEARHGISNAQPPVDQAKPAKRKKSAKRQNQQPAAAAALNANAQASSARTAQTLDTITVSATKTEERAIDALAPVSVVTQEQIQAQQPRRVGDILRTLPGVTIQDRGDDPSTSVNIRGLQDFGRVAVVVDGARQNYQRSGHNANGAFFLDPELIGGIDVVRGPTSNIFGSGAIGGLVSFRTKDIDDVVRPGERWGVDMSGNLKSNRIGGVGSIFGGVRAHPTVDVFGGAVYRSQSNYQDGKGVEIGNTASDVAAGLLKVTTRPADGHQIKFGGIFQDFQYDVGQFNRGPTTATAPAAAIAGTSVYASDVKNYTGTVNWKYSKPDDQIFDWNINLYGNRTDQAQVKTYNAQLTTSNGFCPTGTFGNNITGCTGDRRGYLLDTIGIDINNTSRFGLLGWNNALTYGLDAFRDDVSTFDTRGNSNVTTPGGIRSVSGGFVQLKSNYANWLEVVSAVRYDRYELDSGATSASGDRFSPKITVGVTPLAGFTPYVSYAEGYRAPSITETVITGAHANGGAPFTVPCAGGFQALFCFLPNPNLRPEVGKTKEAGLNLKYDNIFTAGDSFRGKFNVFRNDIDDYIDAVSFGTVSVRLQIPGPPRFTTVNQFFQYQNVGGAKIQGFEAEAFYDAGGWFVGVAGNVLDGENKTTGLGLSSLIQPRKIVTTGGMRFFDRRLTISGQYISYAANNDVPSTFLPATSADIFNVYLAYAPTPDVIINFGIDNVTDKYYRPYAIPRSDSTGSTQNDVLFSSPGPGITYKGGIKIHFGGA